MGWVRGASFPFSPPSSRAQQQRRVGGKADVNQPMNKVQHSQIHTTAGLVFLPTPTNANRKRPTANACSLLAGFCRGWLRPASCTTIVARLHVVDMQAGLGERNLSQFSVALAAAVPCTGNSLISSCDGNDAHFRKLGTSADAARIFGQTLAQRHATAFRAVPAPRYERHMARCRQASTESAWGSARGKISGSYANCSSKAEDKQAQADAEEHGDGFGAHHSWAPQLPLPLPAGPMNIIGCLT